MEILFFIGILVLNGVISWWNAKSCGEAWIETKQLGGFIRLVVLSAAIQSAIGFSMIYLSVLGFGLYSVGYLTQQHLNVLFSLWYIAVIIPILGTGLIITIHSWIVAYRERSIVNMGIAAYNTITQVYNTYQAFDGIGKSLSSISSFFGDVLEDDSDAKTKAFIVLVLLAVIALLGGVLTTATLIKRYAGTLSLPEYRREAIA